MSESAPSSELVILRELLAQESGFVSGSALAAKLGVSRVAVWQHMEKLRSQDFAFQAIRARGYRISDWPKRLNSSFIEALLANANCHCPVLLLDEVDSTNDEAARQLASGREAPFVVIARSQQKGRGRFGRQWQSQTEANLYTSFAFRPQLPPQRMQTFTLWMGVTLCELASSLCRHSPALKWPNDLLINGQKAGGMLTEARMDSDNIRDLICGIGLNVSNSDIPHLDPKAPTASTATCLADHASAPLDINRVAAALIQKVAEAYSAFISGTYLDTFADLWNRYDVLRGKQIAVFQGETRVAGLASGVDDEGALLLRDEKGTLLRFRAGEVSIDKSSL